MFQGFKIERTVDDQSANLTRSMRECPDLKDILEKGDEGDKFNAMCNDTSYVFVVLNKKVFT